MLTHLKNNKKHTFIQFNQQQLSSNPITNLSIFTPPSFPHQQQNLNKTQPITQNNKLPISKNHKKSASTTKYIPKKQDSQIIDKKSINQNNTTNNFIALENEDVIKIIQQSQNLIKNNQLIQGINLLKAMKDPLIKFTNSQLKLVVLMNLAVAYYQTGFLQQAFDDFNLLSQSLAHAAHISSINNKNMKKLLYMTMQGKVQLQICILFSQMGKHQQALKHARKSCKINFELIYQILNILSKQLLSSHKQKITDSKIIEPKIQSKIIEPKIQSKIIGSTGSKQSIQKDKHTEQQYNQLKQQNLINNIILLQHLHKLIGDLNQIFHVPQKIKLSKQLLTQIKYKFNHYKNLKVDMELLLNQDLSNNDNKIDSKLDWIYNNKILDQIQLKSLDPNHFDNQFNITNAQIIQKITYLAISFYCYSTEIRFIEKSKQDLDQNQVMDSQHWLSRSLQIAYSFMPPNAPILNQILTVHDRFHGIDKQTIPQDKQICGYFKVLKPLSKPKSTYSSKLHMCSPIMIRIQAPKITIDIQQPQIQKYQHSSNKLHQQDQKGKIFDLEALTKNNKIKGLNTRIKILQFNDIKQLPETQRTKKSHNNQVTKITSRSTISDLSSLQTQRDKKIRISKIYNVNRKTISEKYNQFKEEPKSMTELQGKAIISQDLLHRPLSYDKNINKWQKIEATTKAYMTQNTKRRKSLPSRNKQKLQKIVYNGSVKFDGLKLTGKKMNQTFEIDSNFLQRLSEAHNNQQSMIQNAKSLGGNIFINNNINLYISKGQQYPKTSRQLGTGIDANTTLKDQISKRQKFISKRRLSHLNIYPSQQFHL